jgi:hypothetical protein
LQKALFFWEKSEKFLRDLLEKRFTLRHGGNKDTKGGKGGKMKNDY